VAPTVAVVGGGYGGIAVAADLDADADVVLIEPRDAFVHHVAGLRSLVDPSWADRLFYPYERLLTRGRTVTDRAVRVDAGSVTLRSGDRIGADFVVLATGAASPYPAKIDVPDTAAARAKLAGTAAELAAASRVLLLGAGPIGLELAGEIAAARPDATITVVDPADDILSGAQFPDELRAELRRQLDALGVRLILGTRLAAPPPGAPGQRGDFIVTTESGESLRADIWFRCYGNTPVTDYLAEPLAAGRTASGHLAVTDHLRLVGQPAVFAIGDVTDVPEAKMAKAAGDHAAVVAENIRRLARGEPTLRSYTPGPLGISLPLGPTGGATYRADVGLLDAAATARLKGATLRTDTYAALFADAPSVAPTGQGAR
jgi:NADH dehydrogenase FAD-containing subunit